MKLHLTSLTLALATAMGTLIAVPAKAAPLTLTTAAVPFNNIASVTDAEDAGATNNNNASLGSSSIAQFNSSLGVLMGATVNLTNSKQTHATQVTSTSGGGTTANFDVTSSGTGSSTVAVSAPGLSNTFSASAITLGDSCIGKWKSDCTGLASTTISSLPSWVGNVSSGSLGSYLGTGTVTVNRTAEILTATQTSNVFSGTESTQSTVTWTGDLSATYDYLLHAAPSFGGGALILDLDFGSVLQGVAATALNFSIFNALGDRVGLDLDSILGSGDTAQLTTNLGLFSGLGTGFSNAFLASFDTSIPGAFAASYVLTLSDADVGAESSRWKDYSLTLNLTGTVTPQQTEPPNNDVPEPATLALVGAGLLGLTLGRRRRQRPG